MIAFLIRRTIPHCLVCEVCRLTLSPIPRPCCLYVAPGSIAGIFLRLRSSAAEEPNEETRVVAMNFPRAASYLRGHKGNPPSPIRPQEPIEVRTIFRPSCPRKNHP